MEAKVQKWGNSLAVRVPKGIAEEVGVKSNDVVDMKIEDGKIVLLPQRAAEYNLKDLVKGISPKNLHASIDTGEAIGREAL